MSNIIECTVVVALEEFPKHARYPKGTRLPLHCTVLYGILVPAERDLLDGLIAELDCLAQGISRGFSLQANARDTFQGIGVGLIDPAHCPELVDMHRRLLDFVTSNGTGEQGSGKGFSLKDTSFTGEQYRPHVADYPDGEKIKKFPTHLTRPATHLALISRTSDISGKCVEQTFRFGPVEY